MPLKARPPEDVKPGHIKGVLFGDAGAGKTWLALSFPAPYYIDTEGGADLPQYTRRLREAGGAYLGPADGACDFDAIAEEIRQLATTKHSYRTLVIDSITKVYHSDIAREADRLGEKDAFGASKKRAIRQMRRLVSLVGPDRLDMNVWFIAHETAEWQNVDGKREEVGRTADAWDKLKYELHLALRIQVHAKGYRTATVDKSRLLGFPVCDRFDIQRDGKDLCYEAMTTRYERSAIEAEAKPIVLVAPEAVIEIRVLLEALRVSDEEVERVLSKAKVERIEDMSADQAAKFVAWLRGKIEKAAGQGASK